ncbi:hypothetical protein BAUCODRAFT_494030 [Baudoinia panamericana UAMH 10762]|uniref:Uncharacterized protein n=1 Tax=Baudoinia panamericana (strain UAMH 10762) TaxID=717646 RepID=M2N908_BAUPA|nr:uncharacterized protein BAUCODRAFT_494030 [Baudoinia panamericana UAMH 10762]EMC95564.1 hypothetical protein BAUCODRAFT_494030 [Baudoinia panamericana UAMH 10762]
MGLHGYSVVTSTEQSGLMSVQRPTPPTPRANHETRSATRNLRTHALASNVVRLYRISCGTPFHRLSIPLANRQLRPDPTHYWPEISTLAVGRRLNSANTLPKYAGMPA